jgi:hypothetical protein
MLYLKQDFDLHPAAPRTRDAFVALAEESLVSADGRHGARLVAAFFGNAEWFFRVTHVLELDGFAAFEAWREKSRQDPAWLDGQRRAAELAPVRREELLEPLGVIPLDALQRATESGREKRRASTPRRFSRSRPGAWRSSRSCSQRPGRACRSWRRGGPSQATPIW